MDEKDSTSNNINMNQKQSQPASNNSSSSSGSVSMMSGSVVTRSLPAVATSGQLTSEHCLAQLEAVLRPLDSSSAAASLLAAQDVRRAWSSYLELVVEPAGWRAVLVPSPSTAATLAVDPGRRGAVLVEVVDVMCDSLEAEVELLHEDLENMLVSVPVDELYPVKIQDHDALNMTPTVVALDLIRFFYKHIWMPWDEDSECEDWPGEHLHSRVRLHFSLVTGSGDQATAVKLDQLAARAELNRTALMELEESGAGDMSYQVLGRMYELHQDQDNIRRQAEMLENPILRMAVEAKTSSCRKKSRQDASAAVLVVWAGGSLAALASVLSALEAELGAGARVTVYPELQHAVDCSVADDVIVIASPGHHQLRGLGGLSAGGRLVSRGCGPASVVILPGDTDSVFCCLEQGSLEIADVNIDCKNVNIGLLVSAGKLTMKNVTVVGGGTAVLVAAEAELSLASCKVTQGGIGLEVASGGSGVVADCVLDKNRIGVSVGAGGRLHVSSSYVGANQEYGLVVHCSASPGQQLEGVWPADPGLARAAARGVAVSSSELGSNGLGDVAVLDLGGAAASPGAQLGAAARRFSTPMSGRSQVAGAGAGTPGLQSRDSPIFPSLSRVLTYPD